MKLRILISLSLALIFWQKAGAQLLPATDFFNSGAQFYISNNIPAALERVEMGLKTYPDDEKLKKLEKLLKQQQQQNQQQNQQQQQQKQQQKQQQSQNDQQKNQQKQQDQQSQPQQQKNQEQQKQDEPKQSQQQKQQEQQQKQEQQSAADKQKAEQEKKQEGEGRPAKPGQMTPEEAKRLLDNQKGDEQLLQLKPPTKPEQNQRPVKDW